LVWWLLVVIGLMAIIGYEFGGYYWLLVWWLFATILLMAIGGY